MTAAKMDQMKVTFFFVGVGKCGTSWIFEIARKKSIFSVPKIKEPYLIDQPPGKQIKFVNSLYGSTDRMADFSNLYYWDDENPKKMFQYNENARAIITIRKPSARIISHFKFLNRNGEFANLSLSQYLDNGDPIELFKRSIYRPMIERYESVLGKSNVLVLPLELLEKSPQAYLDRLTSFCGLKSVVLNPEDLLPVLKQSRARSPIVAKMAKTSAKVLRKIGMLRVLGTLKDSRLLRRVLYREAEKGSSSQEAHGFGQFSQAVADLDTDYVRLLKSYGLSFNAECSEQTR